MEKFLIFFRKNNLKYLTLVGFHYKMMSKLSAGGYLV